MSDDLDAGPEPPAGAPPWMATMADMMSLLLTFFVLLLSFANMDVVKFRVMLGSVKDAFGVQHEHPGDIPATATSVLELSKQESTPFLDIMKPNQPSETSPAGTPEQLAKQVAEMVGQLDIGQLVEVDSNKRGVVVRVKGQLLFESGAVELRPEALIFLDELARLILAFPYDVAIEGHTDDVPMQSADVPTNWHLSVLRAVSTLRYIESASGIPRSRIHASGYADTRPIVENRSAADRATNRRVEFVFLR